MACQAAQLREARQAGCQAGGKAGVDGRHVAHYIVGLQLAEAWQASKNRLWHVLPVRKREPGQFGRSQQAQHVNQGGVRPSATAGKLPELKAAARAIWLVAHLEVLH